MCQANGSGPVVLVFFVSFGVFVGLFSFCGVVSIMWKSSIAHCAGRFSHHHRPAASATTMAVPATMTAPASHQTRLRPFVEGGGGAGMAIGGEASEDSF